MCRWKVCFYYTDAVECWKKLGFGRRLHLLIYFIRVTQDVQSKYHICCVCCNLLLLLLLLLLWPSILSHNFILFVLPFCLGSFSHFSTIQSKFALHIL